MYSSNFREINMGEIPSKSLYRSNHPICDGKQDKDIVLAANNAKIQTVINLSDNIHLLKRKVLCCPWYKKVFNKNDVIALNIGMNFDIVDNKFCERIKGGLLFITEHGPPYLLHCEAGIDRTGFLSINAFGIVYGAKFDDIAKDYMLSFVAVPGCKNWQIDL
jgi:protein tyrosine/serine phosphatase